jgi:hypothetical protein
MLGEAALDEALVLVVEDDQTIQSIVAEALTVCPRVLESYESSVIQEW